MISPGVRIALFLSLLVNIYRVHAGLDLSIDKETGLKAWKLTQRAFSFELIQRLPDQTRAFFQARGFPKRIANDIATQCVLQAIGKNIAKINTTTTISYDLQEWVVQTATLSQGIKSKKQWGEEWSGESLSMAAKLAFRWATFPTQQTFQADGDYNWGMISFNLPPGSKFDLLLKWQQNDSQLSHWIKNIECPPDQ